MIALISNLERNGDVKTLQEVPKRRLRIWNTCRKCSCPSWKSKSSLVLSSTQKPFCVVSGWRWWGWGKTMGLHLQSSAILIVSRRTGLGRTNLGKTSLPLLDRHRHLPEPFHFPESNEDIFWPWASFIIGLRFSEKLSKNIYRQGWEGSLVSWLVNWLPWTHAGHRGLNYSQTLEDFYLLAEMWKLR